MSITNPAPEPRSEQATWWAAGADPTSRPRHPTAIVGPSAGAAPAAVATSVTLGAVAMIACGVALMAGSVTTWLSAHSIPIATGLDNTIAGLIGVNGWATLIGGALLAQFGGLMMVSREPLLRTLGVLTALATVGFAAYELARLVDKISNLNGVHIGAGLIVVAAAALGGLISSVLASR